MIAGDRFPNVPRFNASVTGEYEFPITDALHGLVRADFTHTGRSASQFRPTYVYYDVQPSYRSVNTRIGIEGKGWGTYAFVNNVFNAIGPLSVSSSIGVNDQITSLTPRTVGVMARKAF